MSTSHDVPSAAAAAPEEDAVHYAHRLELPDEAYDGWTFHLLELWKGEWTLGFRAVWRKDGHGGWYGKWTWAPNFRSTRVVGASIEPNEHGPPFVDVTYHVLHDQATGLESLLRNTNLAAEPAAPEEELPAAMMALKRRRMG